MDTVYHNGAKMDKYNINGTEVFTSYQAFGNYFYVMGVNDTTNTSYLVRFNKASNTMDHLSLSPMRFGYGIAIGMDGSIYIRGADVNGYGIKAKVNANFTLSYSNFTSLWYMHSSELSYGRDNYLYFLNAGSGNLDKTDTLFNIQAISTEQFTDSHGQIMFDPWTNKIISSANSSPVVVHNQTTLNQEKTFNWVRSTTESHSLIIDQNYFYWYGYTQDTNYNWLYGIMRLSKTANIDDKGAVLHSSLDTNLGSSNYFFKDYTNGNYILYTSAGDSNLSGGTGSLFIFNSSWSLIQYKTQAQINIPSYSIFVKDMLDPTYYYFLSNQNIIRVNKSTLTIAGTYTYNSSYITGFSLYSYFSTSGAYNQSDALLNIS